MTDRDKLTALLDELFKEGLTMTLGYMADHLMKNGVTVQKHGRWIEQEDPMLDTFYTCSVCKNDFYIEAVGDTLKDLFLYSYCPECGARMDGENNADNR